MIDGIIEGPSDITGPALRLVRADFLGCDLRFVLAQFREKTPF